MTYREAIKYLLEQLPMFQRIGATAYRSNLTNIIRLCNMLGNPQKDLKCIHIAGTNGKGSVTHIIASILQEQGYKVGIFASPHYKDYRERIKINGGYISRPFITQFVSENYEKFKKIDASFFEITTAMAFDYFKEKKVDLAVIETGMGGRLDSTNIISPLLSIITNISYDHQQFLGDTLEKIAGEKAGIIKPGIPVLIGETQRQTKPVFLNKAKSTSSKIYFADREIKDLHIETDLKGNFQKKNIRCVLMAIEILRKQGIKISAAAVRRGLLRVSKNTSFIGRWMLMQKKPLTIFDSAHNEGGLRELQSSLPQLKSGILHFVYGTVGDKDITKILSVLPKTARYYFCKADIPRGMNQEELKNAAIPFGLKGESFSSVKNAFNAAKKNARKNDCILVAGSVFVMAEVL